MFRLLICCLAALLLSGCARRSLTCVVEGTNILTPSGERPVESLAIGDTLLTRTPSGEMVPVTITALGSSISDRALPLHLSSGRVLRVTPEHPIATPEGWTPAGKLAAGDRVRRADDAAAVLAIVPVARSRRVFDLSVSPEETFIASGVLVHNKTMVSPPTLKSMVGAWIAVSDSGELARLQIREDGAFLFSTRHFSKNLWDWEGRVPVSRHNEYLNVDAGESEVATWGGTSTTHPAVLVRWRRDAIEVRCPDDTMGTRFRLVKREDIDTLFGFSSQRVETWLRESTAPGAATPTTAP
jgi:hypothetical protein